MNNTEYKRIGRPRNDAAVTTPPPPQPPIPPRPIDQTASEMATKRALPKPPGKKLTFDEMQAYFKLMTPEMWSHVAVYVYRDYPRIIRQLKDPDAKNYIDCQSQPIDMDYMIEHHGGGKYSVMVTDVEIRGNGNKLFDCDFEISSTKHPPKLNYEELDVNAKQNMAYVQLLQYKGILDGKGHPMTAQPPAGAGTNPDVIKQVLEFVSKMTFDQQEALRHQISPDERSLSKSLGELLLQKIQQDDPSKQLAGLMAVIDKVLASKPADNSNAQFLQLLEFINKTNANQQQIQNESNRTYLAMIEKLIEASRKPEPQPVSNPQLEQLEQLFTFAERLSGLRGGGRGGPRSGWDIGLDYVREFGVPLMQTIANVMTLGRAPNGIPMPSAGTTAGAGATPVAFDPYANPAAMQALARNAAANNPAQTAPNDLMVMLNQAGGLIVNALNNGTPGYHFADYLIGLMGVATHANIAAYGEPALLQTLLSVPQIAVFGEPRLAAFVHEFLNYQQFLDEEDGQQDNQPMEQTAGAR